MEELSVGKIGSFGVCFRGRCQ